ncbi:MAG: PAS domain S-box protein [Anaerolineae bacterium]|nr:PAS domain S-box protein [Anaerolineae bacterium]
MDTHYPTGQEPPETAEPCSEHEQTIQHLKEQLASLEKELLSQKALLDQQIAEHKRIELAIERGKREWEATFDAVLDMIILTDESGKIVRCNRTTIRRLNTTYQSLIGTPITKAFFPNGGDINEVFETTFAEVQFPVLDGWFSIANCQVMLKDAPFGVVHVIKDVTERRLIQEELCKMNDELEERVRQRSLELQQEKETLAITLLSIGDGVISTDQDGIIVLMNNAAEKIIGKPQSEVVGKSLNDVLILRDEKTNEVIENPIARLLRVSGKLESNVGQYIMLEDGGRKLIISTSSAPVRNREGGLVGYVMVINDITEQKRLEEQMALSQKLESIGQLASGIAHEINTPLQYVGDNTHFLKDAFNAIREMVEKHEEITREEYQQKGNLEAALERLQQIRQEIDLDYYIAEIPIALQQSLEGIERVRKIVLAMKSFAHTAGKEKLPANINQAIETTITISRNAWKYVAELSTDLDPNLPPVCCVVDEINQVILNMIINAAQAIQEAIEKGKPSPGKISIATRKDGDHALIEISDTGTGIAPENLRRIFDPFFTTKGVGKGTGQGLALAHNIIVNQHKGSIHVESQLGEGTTFYVRLPINDPDASLEGREEEN